jgi:hypothetical protein
LIPCWRAVGCSPSAVRVVCGPCALVVDAALRVRVAALPPRSTARFSSAHCSWCSHILRSHWLNHFVSALQSVGSQSLLQLLKKYALHGGEMHKKKKHITVGVSRRVCRYCCCLSCFTCWCMAVLESGCSCPGLAYANLVLLRCRSLATLTWASPA